MDNDYDYERDCDCDNDYDYERTLMPPRATNISRVLLLRVRFKTSSIVPRSIGRLRWWWGGELARVVGKWRAVASGGKCVW